MPPTLTNIYPFLTNSDYSGGNTNNEQSNTIQPFLSNLNNTLYNTTQVNQSEPDSNTISPPTLSNTLNTLYNTTITTNQQPTPPTSPTVVEHKVWREGNTIYSKIVYSDGTEDIKTLDLSDYYNETYNDGVNSVDIQDMSDIQKQWITGKGYEYYYTVSLTNGKSGKKVVNVYDYFKQYRYEQTITYPKTNTANIEISLYDGPIWLRDINTQISTSDLLTEDAIIAAYNEIMAGKYSYFWIKQGDTEYSFLVESRQYQPQPNLAVQNAIDGNVEYEILGKEQKQWDFTLYIDSIPKMQFLQQLASNPLCEVKFDELGDYKQALISNVSISRITTGFYNADIEMVIL